METEARSKNTYRNKTMGIVAHRGFWNCEEAGFAKNSVAGLRCAQENGFWGSEFDVNMTSDGVLIVYHDGKIDGKSIEKHPYAEFADFTIANGEKIPTIDEYLEQGKKYPETMLVYEMKPHSCDEVEDRFVELTIAKLKEHELLDPERVMFISFSIHICEVLAKELPGFTVQFLGSSQSPDELAEKGITGLSHGSVLDKVVWDEYHVNMQALSETVNQVPYMQEFMNVDDTTENLPTGRTRSTTVQTRVNQGFFRSAVLSAYNRKCCVTGLDVPSLLIASHIKPWKDSDPETERTNPCNGLSLNALHHEAFDEGVFTIDTDYRILVSKTAQEHYTSEVFYDFFGKYEGRTITLPERFLPSKEMIIYHNSKLKDF